MRRSDREITDISTIREIIKHCQICRLGFYDDGEVYIVPLNFGYLSNGQEDTLYFHSAKVGRKISLIEKNNKVGFEMDTNYKINDGDRAYQYSARFQSIIGNGEVSFVTDDDEKLQGLQSLMFQYTKKNDWSISKVELDSVCIFKMKITKMSCKQHD